MRVKLDTSERIKDLRVEKHLTLEQLAELTGLSSSAIGKYEGGEYKDISAFAIAKLADKLGVSTDYLLCRTENKNHPNTELDALHLGDAAIEVLRTGKFNHRLLSELICHKDFQRFMLDAEIYVDRIADMRINDMNAVLGAVRQMALMKSGGDESDLHLRTLEVAQIREDEYFGSLIADDLKGILAKDLNNPHTLGLEANEVFFLEDSIILVEGQEDVVIFKKIEKELDLSINGDFFGWGVGGAPKMRAFLALFRDMGYRHVVSILDGDKVDVFEELKREYALRTEPIKWQLITHLLLVTGCRRGEIMGLKWDKVDLEHNLLKIDKSLVSTKSKGVYLGDTKTIDVRYLNLPAETVSLLRQYRREQLRLQIANGDRWTNSGYVFTQDNGKHMNPDSITGWLKEFSLRHGLPHINPHAFRHTVASVLLANGTDIVTVSKQLGHASVNTTESFYSHIIEENKAKATECIADVLLRKKAWCIIVWVQF